MIMELAATVHTVLHSEVVGCMLPGLEKGIPRKRRNVVTKSRFVLLTMVAGLLLGLSSAAPLRAQ